MKLFITTSILVLFVAVGTSQTATYKNVSATEFNQLVTKGNGVIVDVRTQGEYDKGYIAGALLINLYDKTAKEQLLKLPKNKPIYMYCYSGARSRNAAGFLIQNGYTDVYNLTRGIISWNAEKLPLKTQAKGTDQKQPDAFTYDQFQTLIKSDNLIFIDFYAPWCVPCKEMMPTIEELKNEYAGTVKIVKINTDASRELTINLKITTIPHFQLYKNGERVFEKDGKMSRTEMVNLFEKYK